MLRLHHQMSITRIQYKLVCSSLCISILITRLEIISIQYLCQKIMIKTEIKFNLFNREVNRFIMISPVFYATPVFFLIVLLPRMFYCLHVTARVTFLFPFFLEQRYNALQYICLLFQELFDYSNYQKFNKTIDNKYNLSMYIVSRKCLLQEKWQELPYVIT